MFDIDTEWTNANWSQRILLNVFHHKGIIVRQLQLKLQNEGTINGLKNVVHNQEPLGTDVTDAAKILK